MLECGPMQLAFSNFATWLGGDCGSHKASLVLSRYIAFFQDIERQWQRVPSYSEMLEFFGADTLRRYRKAVQWLSESGQIVPNSKLKASVAEEHRIRRMVERFPSGTLASLLVSEYAEELRRRSDKRKIQVRTVRLSLTPAIGLLQVSMSQGDGIPVQESVERYLSDHPGQRAALTGFVCFLNDRHQTCLKIPDTTKADALRRAKAEKRLVALARSEWSENTFIEWITYALEYFHGVTGVSQSRVKNMDMISEPLGLSLVFKGQKYFIPVPTFRNGVSAPKSRNRPHSVIRK